jgi:putative component of toxin-antitoxin plasmid stabilization module
LARSLGKLKDRAAGMRIDARIRRLTETANLGAA